MLGTTFMGWEWITVWTALTAIGTLGMAFAAFAALKQWSKQEKLNAKLAFKKSIGTYAWEVAGLSALHSSGMSSTNEYLSASNSFVQCMNSWDFCEGLMSSNETVQKNWQFLIDNHRSLSGNDPKHADIIKACREILAEKFIFE